MIPRLRRISRSLFPHYTDPKYTWVGSVLRIQCYKGKLALFSRFAVIVSKRNYKNTPERNHFKRLVLSEIREKTNFFSGLPFVYYILLPKRSLWEISKDEIATDIWNFYEEQKTREISRN